MDLFFLALTLDHRVGCKSASYFYAQDIINDWQFRFLIGTADEPVSKLTPRQKQCRKSINRQILYSFPEWCT